MQWVGKFLQPYVFSSYSWLAIVYNGDYWMLMDCIFFFIFSCDYLSLRFSSCKISPLECLIPCEWYLERVLESFNFLCTLVLTLLYVMYFEVLAYFCLAINGYKNVCLIASAWMFVCCVMILFGQVLLGPTWIGSSP